MPERGASGRRRGRPAAGTDDSVRESLLRAAGELILREGYEKASIRRIAAAAGTTPAMIHYYYTDKLGLYRALVERTVQPLLDELRARLAPDSSQHFDLASLMTTYMGIFAGNPWIRRLMLDEVLADDGRFRATFIDHIASRVAPMFAEVLKRQQRQQLIRPDLDPALTTLSAISLCVFPLLAAPVLGAVLGVDPLAKDRDRLVRHTARLFRQGVTRWSPAP